MEYRRFIFADLILLLMLVLGSVSCLLGCRVQSRQRELTLSDFDFLTRDTTLEEVINRLGWPDRLVGSGLVGYQYDLIDGRIIELSFFGGQLHALIQERDGAWTELALPMKPKWLTMWRIGKWAIPVFVVLGVGWWIWKQRRKCGRGGATVKQ